MCVVSWSGFAVMGSQEEAGRDQRETYHNEHSAPNPTASAYRMLTESH